MNTWPVVYVLVCLFRFELPSKRRAVMCAIGFTSDSHFASHRLQLAEFCLHAPSPRPGIHGEFCSKNADTTFLTQYVTIGSVYPVPWASFPVTVTQVPI